MANKMRLRPATSEQSSDSKVYLHCFENDNNFECKKESFTERILCSVRRISNNSNFTFFSLKAGRSYFPVLSNAVPDTKRVQVMRMKSKWKRRTES
jgi:hypothetical protein